MVLESESSSSGKVAYNEIESIKKEFPEISVYTWSLEKRSKDEKGRYGALHAKCAVADGRIALVSSANLTPYAL
jgi:cardiolipin synthase A/B